MAKMTKKVATWSREDMRMLKTLVREETKTSAIVPKLTEDATRRKATAFGVRLVGSRRNEKG
jgi:hypothetical protein